MVGSELAAFLEEGLALHIGVRDAMLQPDGARAIAARLEDDRAHLIVYLAEAAAGRILPHLTANGMAAVTFVRPVDDRACQVKGTFCDARPADPDERGLVERKWNGFMQQLELIGIPRANVGGWATWPAVAVRLKITAVFDQTPGSAAGAPIV